MPSATPALPDLAQLRVALALHRYARDEVHVVHADLRDHDWLVTSSKGVFAVNDDGFTTVLAGWYFGICRYGDWLYLFENCGHRLRERPRGRLVRLALRDGRLSDPVVIARGLDCHCHQITVIDGLLHVVDTANQAILRFDLDGRPVDVLHPFDAAHYHHINAIAQIDGRIGVMLHNGRHEPPITSQIAWFDSDWRPIERQALLDTGCHDIIADGDGRLWYAASMSGELVASDGQRLLISSELMTRGIAFGPQRIIVGLSIFGPRERRDALRGMVALCDRAFQRIANIELPGAPAVIIALR
jgi:hypothetical protein